MSANRPEPNETSRPLPVLRAKIDTIDRDVLQLLSRRNALVGEIAQFKRAHGVPIRDFAREREILDDRCRRAAPLGLQRELIESIYRLVLWGSRDRQAALKAEVPIDIESKTVAVIGGHGAMGRCLVDLFADLGHAVMVADLDTQLAATEAAAAADVVVISVPIDVTVDVIGEVAPAVRPESLLLDVTSIKVAPVEAMLASTKASVIGTHPLFAPSVHSLQGQRVALCPARPGGWLPWLEQMLHARGLVVHTCTPEAHDRAMSIVQVLTHFATEVMGRAMTKLGVNLDETLTFTSPVYLLELLMTARHFAQSPSLYAAIQMNNNETHHVVETFVEAAREWSDVVSDGDRDRFQALFEEVRVFFGPFTDQALEQSSFLIDRLVERA